MFRALLTALILSVFATQGGAQGHDPSRLFDKDALLQMIYAGNIDTVEDVLEAAHEIYKAEDATPNDLRIIFQLFTTTNPTVIDFTKRWLLEEPDSIFANTAQAWIDFSASWNVRGERLARQTYPHAMREFRRLQDSAWDHAWVAFESEPGFVPASDALLRTAAQTGRIYDGFDVIAAVMDERPDMGSLYRAIGMTHPGWSQANWHTVAWLCGTYGPMIKWDIEEDPETNCLIEAAMNTHASTHADWGYDMLLAGHAPSLNYLRLFRATHSKANRAEAEFARHYLNRPDVTNFYFARRFDENVAIRYGFDFISYDHLQREKAVARERLEHDPYDPALITTLLKPAGEWVRTDNGEVRLMKMPGLSQEDRRDLMQRRLISSPFDAEHWRDLFLLEGQGLMPDTFQQFDDLLVNAVVYSNHSPSLLSGYLHNKAEAYIRLDMAEKGKLGPEWDAVLARTNRANVILCPMIRAYRLRSLVCETRKDSSCTSNPQFENLYAQTLLDAQKSGICFGERTEEPFNLFFSPIPIDLEGFNPPAPG